MSAKSTIKSIVSHHTEVGSEVCVEGWVRSRRTSKGGFSFIHIYDGSCFDTIQAVADENLANYADVQLLSTGCSVIITGTLVESSGKGQDREIQANSLQVVGWVDDPESYPVSKKQHTYEYLRTVAHLRPRTNTFGAIARVRHAISAAVHQYFNDEGFFWVNTPIITASDCEGAGELFRVSTLDQMQQGAGVKPNYQDDFFGTETFLTVSGQLNLESHACALGKVYTFGPTFRAENSNTSRHLAEFWMIEPEVAFADLAANAKLAEHFLQYVIGKVLAQCPQDMAFFAERVDDKVMERLANVTANPFTVMTYSEAVELLTSTQKKFEFPVSWGTDLQSEHERFITEEVIKGPVVVTDYPKEIKAFYMRLNDDERTVAAMDVLVPGIGEIIGGSQREERLDVLDARMDPELAKELWWYRDLRRYGTVPHAGFGLGLERLVLYITGMENIRDAIPFPRTPNSANF
ncbi:MAG: asparaginyl-tRNA synthetase [Candidatus Azotimanducaceae bacterium]|jgi:asparaginyl-tRNA synthetase|tara:strand:- start:33002 stop:34390 length:1389 start_codon:yes stop_codon:yes gene_type:complete